MGIDLRIYLRFLDYRIIAKSISNATVDCEKIRCQL